MNRKVFCGALWVHPIEGTKKAQMAAAAAHRNACAKEIMLSLFGMLFRRAYAIRVRDDNAKPRPQVLSPALRLTAGEGAEPARRVRASGLGNFHTRVRAIPFRKNIIGGAPRGTRSRAGLSPRSD